MRRMGAPTLVDLDISRLPGALQFDNGLPYPDWSVIHGWIERHIAPPDRPAADVRAQRQWLHRLARALGPCYRLHECDDFLLVADFDDGAARYWFAGCQRTLARIDGYLADLARDAGRGKYVILAPDSRATMYHYLGHFAIPRPDRIGGICLGDESCVSIVVPQDSMGTDRIIDHELTHARLRRMRLPLWLEEGIAERIALLGHWLRGSDHLTTARLTEEGITFWRQRGTDDFLAGRTFRTDDEAFSHSYTLATLLLQRIAATRSPGFGDFLRHAAPEDAGRAACVEHIGRPLESFIEHLLTPRQRA
jgi:hypothetical protein